MQHNLTEDAMKVIKDVKCRACGNATFIWIITDKGINRFCCYECGEVHDLI